MKRLFFVLPSSVSIKNVSEANQDQHYDENIQPLAIGADERPVAAEAVAEIGEERIPKCGAESRVERENPDVHFGGAGGEGNKMTDDRDKAGDENRFLPEFLEEFFREVEMVFVQQ